MKQLNYLCAIALWILFSGYSLMAQNPNWVMPGRFFEPGPVNYTTLPQSPNGVTDPLWAYQGEAATYSSAGYTGPDGNLLLFTVDESVYDKNGWVVGRMRASPNSGFQYERQGYNEVLILPMGNSCSKFAIIFPSSAQNISGTGQYSTSAQMRIYMAVYDIDAPNDYNDYPSFVTGELQGEGTGYDQTLVDISREYGLNHYNPSLSLYGMNSQGVQGNFIKGYQIAATDLIDNCYRYVLICDGVSIIRYKLTSTGFEYDNYSFLTGALGGNDAMRSEMELLALSNGNYRLAVPMQSESAVPSQSIRIFDLNANMELIPGTSQIINLTDASSQRAEPYGLEFDATGRYLYFTHKPNADWPARINVWDVQSNAIAASTFPASIDAFEQSYIERFGTILYLAKGDKIGVIQSPLTPLSPDFNPNFVSITSGYGNDAGLGSTRFRYQLPDQVDDGTYGDFLSYSCDCCSRWGSDVQSFEATGTAVWTPGLNPLNNNSGAIVRITNELRIKAGANIEIQGMQFLFDPTAKVVIEAGGPGQNGGILHLNGTTFTADLTCRDGEAFASCNGPDESPECALNLWQGVRVIGVPTEPQSVYGSTRQGRLFMTNNSMIEYAYYAVLVGHTDNSNDGGGVVTIVNSRFKDNLNGFFFKNYQRIVSGNEAYTLSVIRQSRFYTTTDFLQFGFSGVGKHIELRSLSGLNVRANVFENEAPGSFFGSGRGTGIYTFNSRLRESWQCNGGFMVDCSDGTIVRSLYRNLHVGIDGINSSSSRTVLIHHARFEDNLNCGVRLSGFANNPEVLDCDFWLPRTLKGTIGLSMTACSGYSVEGNTFRATPQVTGNPNGLGVFVQSSGSAANVIYRNRFEDLTTGIQAQGVNANDLDEDQGLVFRCNTFDTPIRNADIWVSSGIVSDDQGACFVGNSASPAGNFFSHNSIYGIPTHYDFRVWYIPGPPASHQQIDYRHHSPPGSIAENRLIPIRYTGTPTGEPNAVQLDACSIPYENAACRVIKTSIGSSFTAGPKSNELPALTADQVTTQASVLEGSIAQLEQSLDGGNTEAIRMAVLEAAPAIIIEPLVQSAGSNVTQTALSALLSDAQGSYAGLAFEALSNAGVANPAAAVIAGNTSSISLPSESDELQWKSTKYELNSLWTAAAEIALKDTNFVLTQSELQALLDLHQPNSAQRLAAVFANENELITPEWVSPKNNPQVMNFGELSLPSATDNGQLPENLEVHYLNNTFDWYGNTAAINAAYGALGLGYSPSPIQFDDVDDKALKPLLSPAQSQTEASFMVKPNPFNEWLQISPLTQLRDHTLMTLEFYDVTGRMVHLEQFGSDVTNRIIDGKTMPKGLVMYRILLDGVSIQSGKLLRME